MSDSDHDFTPTPLEQECLSRLHAEWSRAQEVAREAGKEFARALHLVGRRLGLRGQLLYDFDSGRFSTVAAPDSPPPSAQPE